jgi:hypothetical protein
VGRAAAVLLVFAGLAILAVGALDVGVVALPALATVALFAAAAWRRTRKGARLQALVLALVAPVAAVAVLYLSVEVQEQRLCETAEEDAIERFPHFAGARPSADGDLEGGGCIVRFRAAAPASAVLRYYERALTNRGWHILGTTSLSEAGDVGQLVAERGNLRLTVFWSLEDEGTRLAIDVHD